MIEFLLSIVLILLVISVYFNIKFGIIILNIQDQIEESLDELDERYAIFAKILEKPVFFDSVEIRQVIQEIKGCQDLILKIANKLSNPGNSKK